jgi:hypothetical protein
VYSIQSPQGVPKFGKRFLERGSPTSVLPEGLIEMQAGERIRYIIALTVSLLYKSLARSS